jgi:hypothetical protein
VYAPDSSILVTGNGNGQTPYGVSAQISQQAGNALNRQSDGLFVSTVAAGGVPVYETALRPTGTTGYVYYDSTIPGLLVKSGTTVGYTLPWNMPWGYVNSSQTTAATSASSSTAVNVTGLSVEFTAVANRRYKITIRGMVYSTVDNDLIGVYLRDGSNNTVATYNFSDSGSGPGGYAVHHSIPWIETIGTSGAVTRKVAVARLVGTGTAYYFADANRPALILVEDIGPNGAPS